MKIAIIGATGFIGSNLIKYLPNNYKIVATYTNKKKINLIFFYKLQKSHWRIFQCHY